jgi:hypothetical protein
MSEMERQRDTVVKMRLNSKHTSEEEQHTFLRNGFLNFCP